jgi:hypothetical protein
MGTSRGGFADAGPEDNLSQLRLRLRLAPRLDLLRVGLKDFKQ